MRTYLDLFELDKTVHNAVLSVQRGERERVRISNLQARLQEMEDSNFESTDEDLLAKFEQSEIDIEKEYQPNEFLFEINGVPAISQGDIHTIGAKQKGGKTSTVAILFTGFLGQFGNHIKTLVDDGNALYFDTEMKDNDTCNFGKKIAKLAGVPYAEFKKRIHLFNLRHFSPTEMKAFILFNIEVYKPRLVVIDGIIDLCANFNDIEASQKLVLNYLMKIALENNCAVINVLHTNKTDGYTELRGHLGAFLEQKGTTVMKCEKDEASNIVTVKFTTHRYAPIPEFHFGFDENGYPIDVDQKVAEIKADKELAKKEKSLANTQKIYEERKEVILSILKDKKGVIGRKELVTLAMAKIGKGTSTINDLIKKMKEETSSSIAESDGTISLVNVQLE